MKYKAKNKISKFKSEIKALIRNYEYNQDLTWEEKRILSKLGYLEEKLDDIQYDIEYYCKDVLKGKLYLNGSERFAIYNPDNFGNETYFTCGSAIELYMHDIYEDEYMWHSGRVEAYYNDKKGRNVYCFINSTGENKDLEEGDLVRIRI